MAIYAVDFDNTLSYGQYPECGAPNTRLIKWLKDLQNDGHKLILWTCREGEPLEKAVEWCEIHGLFFDAINDSLQESKDKWGTNPRKIAFDHYIDTTNIIPDYAIEKWTKDHAEQKRRVTKIF